MFLCMNIASDKVVRHSLSYLSVQKWFAGEVPYYVKICPKLTHLKNADFQLIFACSASVVTFSEKVQSLVGSPLRAFQ